MSKSTEFPLTRFFDYSDNTQKTMKSSAVAKIPLDAKTELHLHAYILCVILQTRSYSTSKMPWPWKPG